MNVAAIGVIGVVLLAPLVTSQTPPRTQATASGVVRSATTKLPIAGITVQLRLQGDAVAKTVVTDASGRFLVPNLTPGVYNVSLDEKDYHVDLERVQVRSGTPANLTLYKVPVISGQVVDERGRPVPGIEVCAFAGGESLKARGHAVTRNDGTYQMSDLAATDPLSGYLVAVAAPACDTGRWIAVPEAFRVAAYPTTYAPSAQAIEDAAPVVLPGDVERAGVNITLRPGPTTRVEGTVAPVDEAMMAPIGRVMLVPAASPTSLIREATFGRDGRFAFTRVPPGKYKLVVPPTWGPLQRDRRWGAATVTVATQPVVRVSIAAEPAISVDGRLDFEGHGNAFYNTRMFFSVRLEPVGDAFETAGMPSPFAAPDAAGRFSIPSVMPGTYRITTAGDAPLGWMLSGATIEGTPGDTGNRTDVFDLPLVIRGTRPVGDLALSFTRTPAQVDVTVHDEQGRVVREAAVVLVPSHPKYWTSASTRLRLIESADPRRARPGAATLTPDTPPPVTFDRLPGGDFFVTAVRSLPANWKNPEILASWRLTGTPVRLELGQHQAITVRLTSER